MSLIKSRQPKTYQFNPGDLITAKLAAELLGYESARNLQDPARRLAMKQEFARIGCELTLDILVLGRPRFLRSEIDAFLSKTVDRARIQNNKLTLIRRVS